MYAYQGMPREAALELRLALAAQDYEEHLLLGVTPYVWRHAAYCYALSAGLKFEDGLAAVVAEHARLYGAERPRLNLAADAPSDPVEAV